MRSIGIIGGAGPMAGLLLTQLIIEICQKEYSCKNDEDFPSIILYSFPFLEMLQGLTREKQEKISHQLEQALQLLDRNRCEIVAIACNTLYGFLKKDHKSRDYLLVDMVEEAKKVVTGRRVLILSTSTSSKMKLYGILSAIYLDEGSQRAIDSIIDRILGGKVDQEEANLLCELINQKFKEYPELEGVLLGCSELSLLNYRYSLNIARASIIDPLRLAAEKICTLIFYQQGGKI